MPSRVAFLGYAADARGGIAQFGRRLAEVVGEHADARLIGYRRIYPSFTRPGRQGPDPSARTATVPAVALPVPWSPLSWRATTADLGAFRPDLLVIQWWTPLLGPSVEFIVRGARRGGARTLILCHNHRPHEAIPLSETLTRRALSQVDQVAAFTAPVAEALGAMLPGAEIPVRPLPPLAPAVGGNGAAPTGRLPRLEAPVILFFGNVRAYKGLEDLVAALPLVRREVDATLVVAGTFFEPLERYEAQVAELGVRDSVRFLPDYIPDEDVAQLFAMCDVVALPYRTATGSGITGHAAAAGRPVVVTDVGPLAAMIGGRGIVVPPSDAAGLADGLVRALRDPPPPPAYEPGGWDAWRDFVLEQATIR